VLEVGVRANSRARPLTSTEGHGEALSLSALARPDNEPDREAASPNRARPRALVDHAPDSPGVGTANAADPAVPLPDLPPRGSEP